jgi:hypothetical protein
MNGEPTRAMGSRAARSITSVFAPASLLLLFAAFGAGRFDQLQDFTVVAVAVLVFLAVDGAAGASWGVTCFGTRSDPACSATAPRPRRATKEGCP